MSLLFKRSAVDVAVRSGAGARADRRVGGSPGHAAGVVMAVTSIALGVFWIVTG